MGQSREPEVETEKQGCPPGCSAWGSGGPGPACCGQSSRPGPAGPRARRFPAGFLRNPAARWTGPSEPPGHWSRRAHLEGRTRKGPGRGNRFGHTPSRDRNGAPWMQSASLPRFLSFVRLPWLILLENQPHLPPPLPAHRIQGQASRLLAVLPEPLPGPSSAPRLERSS